MPIELRMRRAKNSPVRMLQFSTENVNDADVCVIDIKSYSKTTYENDVPDGKRRRGPDAILNMAYVGLA